MDRRRFAVAGAGAVFGLDAGRNGREPVLTLKSVRERTAALARGYDSFGPLSAGQYALYLEHRARELVSGGLTGEELRDTVALRAQLLIMQATALGELGYFDEARELAEKAAEIAGRVQDWGTAGHAWAAVAYTMRSTGEGAQAVEIARDAARLGRGHPAGVVALLEEGLAAASLGDDVGAWRAVTAAEQAHTELPGLCWGSAPAYGSDRLHPARLLTFTGRMLAEVGRYDEATPRLRRAAELCALTRDGRQGGWLPFVWLTQALALLGADELGRDKLDESVRLARRAVAQERRRPAGWVNRCLIQVQAQARGRYGEDPFLTLVDATSGWGKPVASE
jgi:tetratricopeptide (TPR) repeat protein